MPVRQCGWCLLLAAMAHFGLAKTAQSSLETRLDQVANKEIERGQAVGLSVAVVSDGKIELLKQYGFSSLEKKALVTAETEFPIGSVSKQFTAACILLLAAERKLSLDDPVGKYFPDLTRASDVKIRDLLNHTSGYSDWYPLDYVDKRLTRPTTPEKVRKAYGALPLDFEPGKYFSYTNTGYLIAARIVEEVTGEGFYRFLNQRILKPIGMVHTHEYRLSGANVVSRYTSFFGGRIEPAELESPGWLLGAGGLMSTPEDLAKWDIALMTGQVLSPESWREMTSPRKLTTGQVSQYGFGQFMGHVFGHRVIAHRGGVAGGNTDNEILPDDKCAFIWVSNFDVTPFGPISSAIMNELVPVEARKSVPDDSSSVSPPVTVAGLPAVEVAKLLYSQILDGKVDRTLLTPECSEYLSEARLTAHRARLQGIGEPTSVSLLGLDERGQMEVANLQFQFGSGSYRMLLYRHKDGKIAEFMVGS